ncbi:hypothetical protein [Haloterrigena turkmenica]|uniref:hypothetical protein n=1 Tax=Haloterrigena turkmenica TaxID=62320 RepID=UPI0006779996|nr:hypothetical protein [Haloterrigena turkmenica]
MDTETNRVAERPTGRDTTTGFGGGLDRRGTEYRSRDDPGAAVVDGVRRTVAADGDRSARSYTGLGAVVETVAASARDSVAPPQSRPDRFVETDHERRVFGPY